MPPYTQKGSDTSAWPNSQLLTSASGSTATISPARSANRKALPAAGSAAISISTMACAGSSRNTQVAMPQASAGCTKSLTSVSAQASRPMRTPPGRYSETPMANSATGPAAVPSSRRNSSKALGSGTESPLTASPATTAQIRGLRAMPARAPESACSQCSSLVSLREAIASEAETTTSRSAIPPATSGAMAAGPRMAGTSAMPM